MIGIKNMNMPNDCGSCNCCEMIIPHSYYCGITKDDINDLYIKPKSCPLVELENYKEKSNE